MSTEQSHALQPHDLTVNKYFKNSQNYQFHQWYPIEVAAQLQSMKDEGGDQDTEIN